MNSSINETFKKNTKEATIEVFDKIKKENQTIESKRNFEQNIEKLSTLTKPASKSPYKKRGKINNYASGHHKNGYYFDERDSKIYNEENGEEYTLQKFEKFEKY